MKKMLKAGLLFCFLFLSVAAGAQAQTPELVKSGIMLYSTPIDVSGTMFFVASGSGTGIELWKSNGTEAGTLLARDLNLGSGNTLFNTSKGMCANGADFFFAADNSTYGRELWKSSGTGDGTVLVKDIKTGTNTSHGIPPNWGPMISYNGALYLTADNGTTGWELWKSDGTPGGTMLLKNINAGSSSSTPFNLTIANNTLFFVANDGSSGAELWRSDGTPGNTVMVKNIQPGSSDSEPPAYLTEMGGILYFTADNSSSLDNRELWRSDGTALGTYMVKEIDPANDSGGLASSTVEAELTAVNDEKIFFEADDGAHGKELWVSDGTEAGTHMVKNIVPDGSNASPYGMRAVDNKLFFGITDGVHGGELWVSDGTEEGTHIVKDINAGAADGYWGHIGSIAVGGTLYFRADDGSTGEELWKSDGTEAGTVRVADLASGSSSSSPASFARIGDSIYFYASGTEGYGLWKFPAPGVSTTTTTTIPPGCVDEDGDGYGLGLDCLGPDCDDDDPLVWDNCTTCTVKIFPRRLSRLFSIIRPFRLFLFKAADGMQFAKDTPIVFADEAAEALFQFPLGKKKRFMLAMVRIRAPLLQATDTYEVNVGGCEGTLKIKAF